MIYSRLLYTEHEHPHNEHGEGAYTIFSTQQTRNVNSLPLSAVCIQKFAVLWEGRPDTRVIDLIEESIVKGVLAPVKLLHASEGTLFIAYDSMLDDGHYEGFVNAWADIASGALYDCWTPLSIVDLKVTNRVESCRLFRNYAPEILENNVLGITDFTSDMFLFWDEWDPENIFGSEPQEGSMARCDFDSFDDDIKF
ncbi:hypothetical protein H7698_24390 [Pseudomonas sp. p50]|uniref:hypothetical protein n=1 Tax=Pseudomonas sp. p50(2008) TaxID=2816832 RepID=UPI00188AB90E|nr:hypothetical protein [Pseudomonas sp. p50(2008)]MBF4559224.1 hypothetical protein [Pseudomonas sp. p50(2008)]